MTTPLHSNYIGGEWIASDDANRNVNPSDLSDTIGEYARASAARPTQAIAAARAAFPGWAASTPQQRADALDRIGTEILPRKDELGHLLSREEGKTLPEGIGEVARAGQIFKFFAGECLRLAGDMLAVGAAGHRRRGHARAARRRRPDHAVELPDRDPGLEDRAGAGLRQLRRASSRPTWCRAAPGRSPTSSRAPACRRACSTS